MLLKTAKALCHAEYQAAAVDGALADLGRLFHEHAHDAPACGPAALAVRQARKLLRAALADLDEDLTAAVLAYEAIEAPPF